MGENTSAPKLPDVVSTICRRRHLSPRAAQAWLFWIQRYVLFHDKRHSREVDPGGIVAFVNQLADRQRATAPTQSQAFNALLFLYREGSSWRLAA